MYIIQDNHIFNTEKFGAIKFDERDFTFYTPGIYGSEDGRVPHPTEDNSVYFFREDNAQKAREEIIDALCQGDCVAIRLKETFGLPGVEKTKEPGLLVERFY